MYLVGTFHSLKWNCPCWHLGRPEFVGICTPISILFATLQSVHAWNVHRMCNQRWERPDGHGTPGGHGSHPATSSRIGATLDSAPCRLVPHSFVMRGIVMAGLWNFGIDLVFNQSGVCLSDSQSLWRKIPVSAIIRALWHCETAIFEEELTRRWAEDNRLLACVPHWSRI